jgi:hypothetical protein
VGAENDEHNRAQRLHPEPTSNPARSRAAGSLAVAFRPTYLMLPKPRGSSTMVARPPVAAEDVHRNGSVEAPSTNAPVDDRRSVP